MHTANSTEATPRRFRRRVAGRPRRGGQVLEVHRLNMVTNVIGFRPVCEARKPALWET